MIKKLFAFTILFTCLASCATNEALQKNFQKGMSKFDFEAGFVMATLNDSPFQTCGYYKYFPDKSIEVFAAKSKETFYIFHYVTDSQGECPGGWIFGSNGDGELLTTANTLSAALDTVDQYGKRQTSPQPSTVVSRNNNELLSSNDSLAKPDLADKEIVIVKAPETQLTGEDILDLQMGEQNNSDIKSTISNNQTEDQRAESYSRRERSPSIDNSLTLVCRGESRADGGDFIRTSKVTTTMHITDKRNCSSNNVSKKDITGSCAFGSYLVLPTIYLTSIASGLIGDPQLPPRVCPDGERVKDGYCHHIKGITITDTRIEGYSQRAGRIMGVGKQFAKLNIDRVTGRLVFNDNDVTIGADCVVQDENTPKKF